MLIYSPGSPNNVDPFFPQAYGSITNANNAKEATDSCLGYPSSTGAYRYSAYAPCVANNGLGSI